MAETEVILTVFKADISELETTASKYEKTMDDVVKSNAKVDKSSKDLGVTVGSVGTKFEAVVQSSERASAAVAETGQEVKKSEGFFRSIATAVSDFAKGAKEGFQTAVKEVGGLRGALDQLKAKFIGSSKDSVQAVNLTGKSIDQLKARLDLLTQKKQSLISPGAIAQTNAQINAVKRQINSLETVTAKTGGGLKGLFGSITQGASQAVPGLGNITSLFSGLLNPITLAGAAVAGFIANFGRLDTVQIFFDSLKIQLDQVGQRLTSFEGFVGLFSASEQAKDAAVATFLANKLDEIGDAQRGVTIANAEAEKRQASLNQVIRDGTKSQAERLKAAADITSIEEARAAKDIQLAQDRLDFANLEIDNAKRLKTTDKNLSDELLDNQARALAELREAEARKIQLVETTERRKNAIIEDGANERATAEAKEQANTARAIAEAARRREAIAQAEASINDVLSTLATERANFQASADEREILGVETKFAKMEEATRAGFEKLAKVTGSDGQAELAQREADAIVQIEAAKNAELTALRAKQAEAIKEQADANLERLRQSLLTETETQREAVLQRLDEDLALAETAFALDAERDAFRLERVKQTEAELSLILSDEQRKRLDAEAAALEERTRLQEAETQMLKDAAEASIAIVTEAALAGEDVQNAAAKAVIAIFLDVLEKLVLGQALAITTGSAAQGATTAGAPGAVAGLAAGAAIAGIVKGLFAVLKSQLTASYEGEAYVTGKQTWPGRDGHLRRLHEGERVVKTDVNREHWDDLEAMAQGRYAEHLEARYIAPVIAALSHRDDAKVNAFVGSDTGQRIAQSVMLAKFYDANIVAGLSRTHKEARAQTAILSEILRANRSRSIRAW